jgi:ABC-type molybdate transport system substrate-binding protein
MFTVSAVSQVGPPERIADAKPGDVRVLATAAIRVPLDAVRADAAKAIGRSLVIEYGSARGNLKDLILDTLKIRDAVKPRHNLTPVPVPLGPGEYEINIYPLSEILANRNLRNTGPVIPELQVPVVVTATISTNTPNAAAATALVSFLRGPAIEPALKGNGFSRR